MPNEINVRKIILNRLHEKLARLGIGDEEINDHFDLVKSGLLSSLEFVDLVASIEKSLNLEIDYERALESDDFTTISGIRKTFQKHLDEKA